MDLKTLAFPLCFAVSLGISYVLTPWMAKTALRIGLVDSPDGRLKNHEKAVPYLGGLSVFIGFLVGISLFYPLDQEILALLLGGTLIFLLGLLDDFGHLPAKTKLLGQALAVLIVLKAGIAIKIAILPPLVAYPLSFIWLLGMINGFNLIDVMDGLSSGVGAVACFFLFVVSITAGQTGVALMSLALLGSLLGFLRYNAHPASIYLGDAGALFVGFMLGAMSMIGVYARNNPVALLAPVLILGVPIFDTLFVIVIRLMRGVPVMSGSPDHAALRLRKWRLSVTQTVLISCLVSFLLGTAGLVMIFGGQKAAVVVLALVSLLTLGAALWLKKIDMTM